MPARLLSISLGAVSLLSLILLPAPILGQASQVNADTMKSLIEIRFARREPTPGFRAMTDPLSKGLVYVSGETLFTDADFAQVRASTGVTNGLTLNARWKGDAAARWAEIRRGKVGAGNEIAVFVDGELVSVAPNLIDPNATGTVPVGIGVPVAADKRKHITDAVAARWPPSPPGAR